MNIHCRRLALVPGATIVLNLPVRVDEALAQVMVTGRQPGPGRFKVTSPGDPNGHVLWILGNQSPLPSKMTWRSTEPAAVLSVDEILKPNGCVAQLKNRGYIVGDS